MINSVKYFFKITFKLNKTLELMNLLILHPFNQKYIQKIQANLDVLSKDKHLYKLGLRQHNVKFLIKNLEFEDLYRQVRQVLIKLIKQLPYSYDQMFTHYIHDCQFVLKQPKMDTFDHLILILTDWLILEERVPKSNLDVLAPNLVNLNKYGINEEMLLVNIYSAEFEQNTL